MILDIYWSYLRLSLNIVDNNLSETTILKFWSKFFFDNYPLYILCQYLSTINAINATAGTAANESMGFDPNAISLVKSCY